MTSASTEKYCQYLYKAISIPIYIYKDKNLISCFPQLEYNILPPSNYLNDLFQSRKVVSYVQTKFYSYFGAVKLNNFISIIIGPVCDIPYTKPILTEARKSYDLDIKELETFSSFLYNIPNHNLYNFIHTLLLINYNLNRTKLTLEDILEEKGPHIENTIYKTYSKEIYNDKEEGILQNNYELENEFLHCIETGNLKKLDEISEKAKKTKVGIIAHDTLRQAKNTFIVNTTLVARAAIRGGMSPNIAYKLSDIYIKQAERLTDIDSIFLLIKQVQIDYTNRVANSILPVATDHILFKVIQYVHENTNKNITVKEIAEYVGFSRPYLSRKFKSELGFSLSDFIRRCKLEEAKYLLAYSDKSISDISNYLCFSSQSHFQKAFKDQYNVTPNIYRSSSSKASNSGTRPH